MEDSFYCDRCGACCLQLPLFGDIYAFLDNGTGVCRYYDAEARVCSIYEIRPLLCRVEEGYKAYFSNIPYTIYLDHVYAGCRILKQCLYKKCCEEKKILH